ncbi:MAG TPA: hypothetical protein VN698_06155 [Bacteroidia bacterium]|nr:hypothetical protein [Bacteroidia bacterium]
MQKFEYDISVPANSQQEADTKMKAIVAVVNKLSVQELTKIAEVVSDPVQLALIKLKLL